MALVTVLVGSGCAQGHGAVPAAALEATPPAAVVTPDAAVVGTESGPVRGVVEADHRLFAGIPFAAPPVGPLRWQPPRAPAPWTEVRDATRPGPACIQDLTGAGREDCLTLNVWTPVRRAAQRRPVLVWIHGGGFINGHGDIYGARRLAARGDIVVVTLNYRLGALGFLAHPALGPHGRVGNYGLLDQQAALRWVRDNISHFGGDPAKVTIAGESAGAMSVCDHLVAPASAGLFRSAIIQSGPCHAQVDIDTGERISETFAADLGCGGPDGDPQDIARCLRALPADRLATSPWYVHIDTHSLTGPVTGTAVLPVDPVDGFAAGRGARVPVLVGSNHDEFTMFAALTYRRTGATLTAAEYPAALARTMGDDAAAVRAQYPPARHGGSVSLAFSAAVGDHVFACVANRMAEALAAHPPPVYAYEFADPHPPAPQGLAGIPFPLGASHALEVGYLFDIAGLPAPSPAQRRLADQMIDYWTRFVITGDPNGPGQPRWPAFTDRTGGARWMSLRPDGSRVITDFAADHQCGFWDALAARER
ncbi:carboxylesterase family protein [Mycobacterium koreense]|uniref:Carboxylic ester hydrolase n=1 Tax=Mycolicibacillus koreensis TaxID=1069220 RepID=A0A7I7SF26_9MYCO|nr:carboxylesterase/lipase family protein [Mycolicibacillus koreensis]MCV7248086.1 carboxylesterase family protein [Mycolicibacillus koreensis]OSC35861.1 carboxylesterase [Mycolicibacillus koreensis]BBY55021.1 carboxylic ester hydrolase [Mycolicibacillus koreensis]